MVHCTNIVLFICVHNGSLWSLQHSNNIAVRSSQSSFIRRFSSASVTDFVQTRWYKNIDDTILVSEFGSKLFILVCTWRLLCDYGGLSEEESDPKYLLWWLYMVRNYPRTKTFARDVTLISPQHSRKHIYPIKEAMLKIKRYVVS